MLRRRLWRSSSVRPSRVDAILRRRLYRHDDHDHRPTATEKGGRETQKTATDCEAAGGIRLRTSSASSPTRKNRNDAEDRRTHDPESEQQRGTNNTTAPVNKSRFENYDHTRGQGRGVGRGSVVGRGYMMGNESGGGRFRSGGRGREDRGRGRGHGLPELMLCFTSALSLAVRPSRVDAILRRRLHRFYLPEMLQCFASAPSSAVWEPSSDPPSSFGTSQIDAMLRFASAPSFVRPSQADAVLRFSAIFASAFPS